MSNRVCVQATTFENVPDGEKSYGFRMYDDYGQTYCNTVESPLTEDDLDVLRIVMDNLDDISSSMIDHIIENEQGIYISDNWYEYEEIKDILKR